MRAAGVILLLFGIVGLVLPLFGVQNRLILLVQLAVGRYGPVVPVVLIVLGALLFLGSANDLSVGEILRVFRRPRRLTEEEVAELVAKGYPSKEAILSGARPRTFDAADVDRLYPYIEDIMRRLWDGEEFYEVASDIANKAGYSIPADVQTFMFRLDHMDQEGLIPHIGEGRPTEFHR